MGTSNYGVGNGGNYGWERVATTEKETAAIATEEGTAAIPTEKGTAATTEGQAATTMERGHCSKGIQNSSMWIENSPLYPATGSDLLFDPNSLSSLFEITEPGFMRPEEPPWSRRNAAVLQSANILLSLGLVFLLFGSSDLYFQIDDLSFMPRDD